MNDAARTVDDFLRQLIARSVVPGVSVAIKSPRFEHHAAFGTAALAGNTPMTCETRFSLGCITKLFTGVVALHMASEGRLDLDAPIQAYLPELGGRTPCEPILVRHLAGHTSGFEGANLADPKVSHLMNWEKFVEFFRSTPQTFSPGAVFNYDHTEHVILGEIVRRISGRSGVELFEERVLGPAGFSAGSALEFANGTGSRAADHASDPQTGTLRQIPAMPFGKFWEFSLSRFAMSPSEILRAVDWLTSEQDPRVCDTVVKLPTMFGPPGHEKIPLGFSSCCARFGETLFGHNGSARGQTCGVRFDPENRFSIVVALNAWQPSIRDLILGKLVELLRSTCGLAACAQEAAGAVDLSLEQHAGSYLGGVHGTRIDAEFADGMLNFEISSRYSNAPVRIGVRKNHAGTVSVGEEAGHLSLGFFSDPADQQPCVMVALNAFKRLH